MKISAIDYYLPERILRNEELEKVFENLSADKIKEKTGIEARHIAADGETSVDMACKAALKLFQNFDREKVDCIILCTQTPDYYLPASACVVHERLKLKTSVAAFDINQGCSGYVYGLAIAKGMIKAGISRCVLLITSETYSKLINENDKSVRTIFGDAAAATIIEDSNDEQISEFVLGTDGRGYKNLIVPNGGLRTRYTPSAPKVVDENGSERTENDLFMDGPEIFNFTIESVPALFNDVLLANKMSIVDLSYVIFHQANKYMISYLRKKIKISEEKFYQDMHDTGNTVSSTIPIALKKSMEKSRLSTGDRVMLVGFGVGYSWGGTVVTM